MGLAREKIETRKPLRHGYDFHPACPAVFGNQLVFVSHLLSSFLFRAGRRSKPCRWPSQFRPPESKRLWLNCLVCTECRLASCAPLLTFAAQFSPNRRGWRVAFPPNPCG